MSERQERLEADRERRADTRTGKDVAAAVGGVAEALAATILPLSHAGTEDQYGDWTITIAHGGASLSVKMSPRSLRALGENEPLEGAAPPRGYGDQPEIDARGGARA